MGLGVGWGHRETGTDRFDIGELYRGKAERVGMGAGWGHRETGTDRFDRHDDLHYIQVTFNKWETLPG